jgi:hypothetical protein
MTPFAKAVSIATIGITVAACWRSTYTPALSVKETARHYSDVMDDFADQALLANVLRARDYAPMNFHDLSTITVALSLSGTVRFAVAFGPFIDNQYVPAPTRTAGTFRNTFSPSVTGSTSL